MQCLQCQTPLSLAQKKYCSNQCQKDREHSEYIKAWKMGVNDGGRGKLTRNLSGHLIRYLRETRGSCCEKCGWKEVHPQTGRIPLEIDHIDGDSGHNTEGNLRLLCPNCHSLTPSYRNLNKGNGRLWRREKYVIIDKEMPL